MMSYLYEYVIFDPEINREIARYGSNAAPPAVGSFMNLEHIKIKDFPAWYRVDAVISEPMESDESSIAAPTVITLYVRAIDEEDI